MLLVLNLVADRRVLFLFGTLVLMGAGWGLTQPLSKIAVSAGYRHVTLVFWQMMIGALFLFAIRLIHFEAGPTGTRLTLRRRRFRFDRPAMMVYLFVALVGTVFPNSATYEAIRHLPSGLISILLSLVPMFAFPIALALGNERFKFSRFLGLAFGMIGVGLIVAPEASLPDRALVVFVPLALVAPFFYGLEGNVVARWGTAGLSPVDVLFGASLIGALIAFPLVLFGGYAFSRGAGIGLPELCILGSALIHVIVYSSYVWMVGVAGPVFAVQVSYLVTGFGVLWAILLLGEGYSGWIWLAMGVILAGVFLVQPRAVDELVPEPVRDGTGEQGR